ncbi:S-formylglutathione hydrolase [Mycotypha africana]|uniref:S-formylglutathione hydrolase n=1 Tax=Mycotypha africana TaxID=64632 RepID=UPI002301EDB3|nr:S-formylglutathione hydrolase [Mycotypha africana]KAI8967304.1 S-formylglutathione hydrolase [Mycotypha africana]
MALKEISKNKCFNGHVVKYEHVSQELQCTIKFNVFLPAEALSCSAPQKVPAIYFLSGLTCTEDNFTQKSGAMAEAAKHGIALIMPDTSPRGVPIEGDEDSWDFGTGAGFYLDATHPKWAKHYRMYSYVVKELPALIYKELPIDETRVSIMGHSMGGHGALTIYLKNPEKYRSVSALSPIAHPTQCPWGQKAFSNYLDANDKEAWKEYDTVELLKKKPTQLQQQNVLIDVGTADGFLEKELLIDHLERVTKELNVEKQWKIRYQEGYDHSYFFIATFIADHIQHHAAALK